MRAFRAGQNVPHLGKNRGGTAIGAVHVKPDAVLLRQVRNLRNRIHACDRSGACGRDNGARAQAGANVLGKRTLQKIGPHAERAINADLADIRLPEAESDARFLRRGMR